MNGTVDHSRFADIFGDQNDYEDVSLESALAATKQPDSKTIKQEAYDTELGWVEEYVTVKPVTNEPSPIVAFLRSMNWTR